MNVQNIKVAIVGSSIGGLSAANVLNRLGFEVTVFEAFSDGFQNRGGALGSVDIQLLQTILPTGTIQKRIRNHGHFYGDLWQYLYEGLPKSSVKFGVDIEEIINPESLKPIVEIEGKHQEYDLIIGADGGKSTIRKYVTDSTPQYAGYTLWRTLLSTDNINYPPSGSKTINGIRYETLGFPFIGASQESLWNCGVYMAMPESEVEKPTRNRQVSTQNILNKNIFLTTLKIQEEFSELVKYLEEIPRNCQSNTGKGVSLKALKDYLDSLNNLLETYAKEH